MRVSEKTRISTDRETVWAWVRDPARYPQFMDGVSRWSVIGDQDTGCGARWDVKLMVGAAPVGGIVEVVEFDKPGDIAWNSVTGVTMRGRWRIRTRANGLTEVDLRLSYQAPGGLMGLIADWVAEPMVRRSLKRSLRNLRMLVESRPAPQQAASAGPVSQPAEPRPATDPKPATKKTATKKTAAKKAATKKKAPAAATTPAPATPAAVKATKRSAAAKKTTKAAAPRKRTASAN